MSVNGDKNADLMELLVSLDKGTSITSEWHLTVSTKAPQQEGAFLPLWREPSLLLTLDGTVSTHKRSLMPGLGGGSFGRAGWGKAG